MTKRAAVIGYPIKHSLSPVIHNYWLKKYGIDGIYEKIEVKPEGLQKFLEDMKSDDDFVGCNVTVPHKEVVFEILLDEGVDESALAIGASNTVTSYSDDLSGYNTDVEGFIENIISKEPSFKLKDGKAVVVGAGGAARAIIFGLILQRLLL